eukprot:6808-Heterococcus_DN1.PRE.2
MRDRVCVAKSLAFTHSTAACTHRGANTVGADTLSEGLAIRLLREIMRRQKLTYKLANFAAPVQGCLHNCRDFLSCGIFEPASWHDAFRQKCLLHLINSNSSSYSGDSSQQ